jgi:prepilin-type N-terminal cleavage/methylation domain-containing protein
VLVKKEDEMKKGFTLAEVLITLGIIGVVAALTIPGLIADYQEKQWTTAREVFLNRINEATRVMNVNENFVGYPTTEAFVDELVKNLKTIKVCKTNPQDCFNDKITNGEGTETVETKNLKNSSDMNEGNWGTKVVGLTLVNGYSVLLAYDPNCPLMDISVTGSELTSCLSVVYDVNGKGKPNKITKDINLINAEISNCDGVKVGSMCVAGSTSTYGAVNTCSGSADMKYDGTIAKHGYCSGNYWAGALKACELQGMRVPTKAEMDAMAAAGVLEEKYYFTSTAYTTTPYGGSGHCEACFFWEYHIKVANTGYWGQKDHKPSLLCVK